MEAEVRHRRSRKEQGHCPKKSFDVGDMKVKQNFASSRLK